ncbi:MAG: hypothetical protein A2Y36_01610 [Treponema sp. GWA1_62_8]|nr:MAG: hypothetical protein A2Y36_01610 [Treponema sp. GWA1_62_8]
MTHVLPAHQVDRLLLGNQDHFDLLVLVQDLRPHQLAILGDEGVEMVGHHRGIGGKGAEGDYHVGGVAGLFQQFPVDGEHGILPFVDYSAGKFDGNPSCTVAVLLDHHESGPVLRLHDRNHARPVAGVDQVELPVFAVGRFALGFGDFEYSAIQKVSPAPLNPFAVFPHGTSVGPKADRGKPPRLPHPNVNA